MMVLTTKRSPLHGTFQDGLLDMTRLLVNKGASLDHVDSQGRTMMHHLILNWCEHGQLVQNWEHGIALPFVKHLVSMSYEDFDTPGVSRCTPLSPTAELGASDLWFTLLGMELLCMGLGRFLHVICYTTQPSAVARPS